MVIIAFHTCHVFYLTDFIGLQKSCSEYKSVYVKYTRPSHLHNQRWLRQTNLTLSEQFEIVGRLFSFYKSVKGGICVELLSLSSNTDFKGASLRPVSTEVIL